MTRILAPLSFLILILLIASLGATTVEKLSLEDLVQKAQKIIVGRCLSTESRWNEKSTLILTYSKFAVGENLKSHSNGSLTVVTVGGSVGGITQTVSGMPQFVPNEEAVLFLEPSKDHHWQIVGLSQGKFQIVKDLRTGYKEVIHSLSGLQLYDTSTHTLSSQAKPYRVPLDDLIVGIKNLIAK